MFWVLVTVLVVVPAVLLVVLVLNTKRHLKTVQASVLGSVAQVQARVDEIQQARPPAPPTCPTCGQATPTPAVTSRAPARSR